MQYEDEEEEYQLEIDPSLVCRICLKEETGLKNLFRREIIEGSAVGLPKIFQEMLQVKIVKNDPLPQQVCTSCCNTLIEFYQLQRKCLSSHQLMHAHLQPGYDFKLTPTTVPSPRFKKESQETQTDFMSCKVEVEERGLNENEAFELGCSFSTILMKLQQASTLQSTSENLQKMAEMYRDATKCTFCDESLASSVKLQAHMKDMHEEILTSTLELVESLLAVPDEEPADQYEEEQQVEQEEYLEPEEEPEIVEEEEEEPEIEYLERIEVVQDDEIISIEKEEQIPVPNEVTCNFCHKLYRGHESIEEHKEIHEEVMPLLLAHFQCFMCEVCSIVLMNIEEMERHSCAHPSKVEIEYFDEIFAIDSDGMKLSVFRKHELEDGQCRIEAYEHDTFGPNQFFGCTVCGRYFRNVLDIKCHLLQHLSSLSCPFQGCSNQYDFSNRLLMHIKHNHKSRDKLVCNYCKTTFAEYKVYFAHIKCDCPKRQLQCRFCDRRFFNISSVKNHEKTHNEQKDVSCDFCQKKFTQTSDLRNHRRIHSKEKPYKCSICDKQFRTPSHRDDHVTTHNETKTSECPYCKNMFKSDRVMKAHMKTHTQGKTHSCPICGKLFNRSYHVKLHLKTHMKAKQPEGSSELQRIKGEGSE